MKKKYKIAAFFLILAMWMLFGTYTTVSYQKVEAEETPVLVIEEVKAPKWVELSHQQEVWMHALEWHESAGKKVINPKDVDGTPSHNWYQFKPATFKEFGEKYGLIKKGTSMAKIMVLLDDYELTENIVRHMIVDKNISNKQWAKSLFPGTIKKIGLPPRS